MRAFKTAFLVLVLLMSRCGKDVQHETAFMKQDPHSYSKPAEAVVKHLKWTASVNFDSKTIDGVASWTIENTGDADSILLDTKDLRIKKVTLDNNQPAAFRLTEKDSILGQALAISIKSDTKTINIQYQTSPEAEALQWLSPQQTAGKNFPFLFTQSQAILARSWIPCQDTPGVRFTYEANVNVPIDLIALMSASNPQKKNATGEYHFEMRQPIP